MSSAPWIAGGLFLASVTGLYLLTRNEGQASALPARGAGAPRKQHILIKGNQVQFERADGVILALPPSYGMIHDPTGRQFSKCSVFFTPFRRSKTSADMTREARLYFGSNYDGKTSTFDVPKRAWSSVADVVQIFYRRPGVHEGKYFHPFKRQSTPLRLYRSGAAYRLDLPPGCVVNDRGYVWP